MNKESLYQSAIITLLLVVGFFAFISIPDKSEVIVLTDDEVDSQLLALMNAEKEYVNAYSEDKIAEGLYTEAMLGYEAGEYLVTEAKCEEARKHFSKSSQNYKVIEAELAAAGESVELVTIYREMMLKHSKKSENLYEACEYFETAARAYSKYFSDDGLARDLFMAGNSIESMNEKIMEHDDNVRAINSLLAQYDVRVKNQILEVKNE